VGHSITDITLSASYTLFCDATITLDGHTESKHEHRVTATSSPPLPAQAKIIIIKTGKTKIEYRRAIIPQINLYIIEGHIDVVEVEVEVERERERRHWTTALMQTRVPRIQGRITGGQNGGDARQSGNTGRRYGRYWTQILMTQLGENEEQTRKTWYITNPARARYGVPFARALTR
jgi:hypothetical protein